MADEILSQEDFDAELRQMTSPKMKRVALRYPATQCYRHANNPFWHVWIASYYMLNEEGPVFVVLMHGRDSTTPGSRVYHQDATLLLPCSCGKWQWPTERQLAERRAELARLQTQHAMKVRDLTREHGRSKA
jgi:hypothetical protein